MRIDSCSSPRPTTFTVSGLSVSSRRIDTLPISSRSSRSRTCRDVTYCPSRPAIGDVLTPKIIDTVGSSTAIIVHRHLALDFGDGLADGDVGHARQTDDVAGRGVVDVDALQAVERIQLRDLRLARLRRRRADGDLVADLHPAVEDAADGDASQVVARIEVRDQKLQRRVERSHRRRHVLRRSRRTAAEDPRPVSSRSSVAVPDPAVRVHDRKIELRFRRVEIDEEIEDLVEHFGRARVGPIDLVDDDDRRKAARERLAEHEARLRQRAFGRVDQQHDPVDHRQGALDFAAEVGVARRVDDVDQQVVVVDRGVLRQDRDAALALELVAVHGALGHALVRAECAALVQHRVDERGLAVIDVGDDGDVAAIRVGDRGRISRRRHPNSIVAELVSDHSAVRYHLSLSRSSPHVQASNHRLRRLLVVRLARRRARRKMFQLRPAQSRAVGVRAAAAKPRQRSRLRAARHLGLQRAVRHLAAALAATRCGMGGGLFGFLAPDLRHALSARAPAAECRCSASAAGGRCSAPAGCTAACCTSSST